VPRYQELEELQMQPVGIDGGIIVIVIALNTDMISHQIVLSNSI